MKFRSLTLVIDLAIDLGKAYSNSSNLGSLIGLSCKLFTNYANYALIMQVKHLNFYISCHLLCVCSWQLPQIGGLKKATLYLTISTCQDSLMRSSENRQRFWEKAEEATLSYCFSECYSSSTGFVLKVQVEVPCVCV